MSLVLNNSVGWACLQMSGGWKRIAWICSAIAVFAPLLIFGSLQLNHANTASTLGGWYAMLGVVQGGLLGVGVPSRVHAAIKRDRVAKIFESHRLMPVPAGHAIAGYIVGANLLLLSCIATLFAIGLVISLPAEQDWRGWIALHGAAAGISATVCCLVAFTSQWLPRLNPALFVVIFGPTLGAASSIFLPPMRVLLSPYVGNGFFELQRGEVTGHLVLAVAAQILLSAILLIGACRRYRRDDVPALGFGWGFALLGLWIALTLVGVLGDEPQRFGPFRAAEQEGIAYVVALTLSLLLAIGPLASSAAASLRWIERHAADAHFIERRPLLPAVAASMVGVALLALLFAAPLHVRALLGLRDAMPIQRLHLFLIGVAIVLFVTTMAGLARAAARLRLPAAALVVSWLVALWVAPPLVDGTITLLRGNFETYPHALSAASTPFCLALILADRTSAAESGLVAQAGAIVALALAWKLIKRSNRRVKGRAFSAESAIA